MIKILLRYISRNWQNPERIIFRICEYTLLILKRKIFLYWIEFGLFLKNRFKIENFSFIDNEIIIITKDTTKFIYTPDSYQTLDIEFGKKWEETELNLFKKYLTRSGIFIDVGSHIGWYAINLAVTKNVKVFAFEPSTENFEVLLKNIKLNHLEDVIIAEKKALGDKTKKTKFTKSDQLGNRILPSKTSLDHAYELVEMATLDSYVKLKNLKNIQGIKCDIEGAELFMLEGAKRTIEKYHPYILLEIQQEWTQRYGYDANRIFSFMEKLGYKYLCITDSGKIKKPTQRSKELTQSHNFFFYYN